MNTDLITAAVKIIILLPLVTALAYFLIKYGLARQYYVPGKKRHMRVVEQIPLGQKSFLSLIDVGGRYILMAHSEAGFKVIGEMDELPPPLEIQEYMSTDWKDVADSLKKSARRNKWLRKIFSLTGKQK